MTFARVPCTCTSPDPGACVPSAVSVAVRRSRVRWRARHPTWYLPVTEPPVFTRNRTCTVAAVVVRGRTTGDGAWKIIGIARVVPTYAIGRPRPVHWGVAGCVRAADGRAFTCPRRRPGGGVCIGNEVHRCIYDVRAVH